jgi:hypothetical protein
MHEIYRAFRRLICGLVVVTALASCSAGATHSLVPRTQALQTNESRTIRAVSIGRARTQTDIDAWAAYRAKHGAAGQRATRGEPARVESDGTRHFEVSSWAPTPGVYLVYASTFNAAGNGTPIPVMVVTMTQAGSVVTTIDVPPNVDMSNGVDVDFLGPNGDDDMFSYNCDSGEFSVSFDPADTFPSGDF